MGRAQTQSPAGQAQISIAHLICAKNDDGIRVVGIAQKNQPAVRAVFPISFQNNGMIAWLVIKRQPIRVNVDSKMNPARSSLGLNVAGSQRDS